MATIIFIESPAADLLTEVCYRLGSGMGSVTSLLMTSSVSANVTAPSSSEVAGESGGFCTFSTDQEVFHL